MCSIQKLLFLKGALSRYSVIFLRHFVVGKNNGGRASFQAKRAQQVSCLSIIVVYIVLCSEIYATAPETCESLTSLERSLDQEWQDNPRSIRGAPQACFGFHEFSPFFMDKPVFLFSLGFLDLISKPIIVRERNDFARVTG